MKPIIGRLVSRVKSVSKIKSFLIILIKNNTTIKPRKGREYIEISLKIFFINNLINL